IGRHLRILDDPRPPEMLVVGVVNDVKQFALDTAPTADLYVPLRQMAASQAAAVAARMFWVMRTGGDASRELQLVGRGVHAVDADVAASSVRTFDEVLSSSLSARRVNVRLLEVFSQLAIFLVVIGVYAVSSCSSASRRRELAIRSACGASGRSLIWLMVRGEL